MHIAVVGLGPAGALLAYRAASSGWTVDAYDPGCADGADGPLLPLWRHTYGVFTDDLPAWAHDVLVFSATSDDLEVHTPRRRTLAGRRYAILDRQATRRRLSTAGPGLRVRRAKVTDLSPAALGADVVVDCRGVVTRPGDIRQIAYGAVLSTEDAVDSAPVFMDWRPSPGEAPGEPPSFLYVQPVDGGTLFEETVLVTREPAREVLDLLRRRLEERLPPVRSGAGVTATETVHFPVDRRTRGWFTGVRDGVAVFGAAGGLTHPATGYSVGASAAAVDRMLRLLEDSSLPWWERFSAACAYRLRLFGAELILAADGRTLRRFFDAFFDLPPWLQTSYLSGQDGGRVVWAMLALARHPRRVLPFLRNIPAALRAMVTTRRS